MRTVVVVEFVCARDMGVRFASMLAWPYKGFSLLLLRVRFEMSSLGFYRCSAVAGLAKLQCSPFAQRGGTESACEVPIQRRGAARVAKIRYSGVNHGGRLGFLLPFENQV